MINHKSYIGITSQKPEIRWGTNGCNYHDSPKFWNAIQKYGWNMFEHIIIKDNLSQQEARIMEIETIEKYDSIKNGYNISPGGDMPPVFYGEDNHNYRNHFSDETRMKMSQNHADVRDDKNPAAKRVVCIETGEIFGSMTLAGKFAHVNSGNISACCCGRQKTSGGYHWKYCD